MALLYWHRAFTHFFLFIFAGEMCLKESGCLYAHRTLLLNKCLKAGRLTAGKLTAGRLTADRLTAGRLTAGRLTAGR